MLPYYVTIGLSICCAGVAFVHENKSIVFVIFSIPALMLPCFLAAFRDPGVGIDMLSYSEQLYEFAATHNVLQVLERDSTEPLFNMVAYISAHLFCSKYAFYFLVQLLICLPTYIGITVNCVKEYRWLAWLLFLLLFYGYSLNLMRQSIAVALCFSCTSYLFRGCYERYILVVILAAGFHLTAIVMLSGIVLCAMYRNRPITVVSFGMLVIACIGVLLFAPELINVASSIKQSYSYQVEHTEAISFASVLIGIGKKIILFAPVLLATLLNWAFISKNNVEFRFLFVMFCISILLLQLGTISDQMFRLALPLYYFTILFLPLVLSSVRGDQDRFIYIFTSVAILVLHLPGHLYSNGAVAPYTSLALGIG